MSRVPPGQWQTYDIDFKAPQFDAANGAQVRGAVVTVSVEWREDSRCGGGSNE